VHNTPQCKTCQHYDVGSRIANHEKGPRCLLNPPKVHAVPIVENGQSMIKFLSIFPSTEPDDRCGSWVTTEPYITAV